MSFSPIIAKSRTLYGVSETAIVLLGTSYLIAYVFMNFSACYHIDRFGLKWSVGIGIIITGIFSLLRGIFTENYFIVVISQWMWAIGQPFILNSFTKMSATWFPNNEKALSLFIEEYEHGFEQGNDLEINQSHETDSFTGRRTTKQEMLIRP